MMVVVMMLVVVVVMVHLRNGMGHNAQTVLHDTTSFSKSTPRDTVVDTEKQRAYAYAIDDVLLLGLARAWPLGFI